MKTKKSKTAKGHLNFLNLDKIQRGGNQVKITKTGIYFGPEPAKQLDIKKGDYILLAESGGKTYVGKKPKGVFGGNRISCHPKRASRPFAQMKTAQYDLRIGGYALGQAVDTTLLNEQGGETLVTVYPLVAP